MSDFFGKSIEYIHSLKLRKALALNIVCGMIAKAGPKANALEIVIEKESMYELSSTHSKEAEKLFIQDDFVAAE